MASTKSIDKKRSKQCHKNCIFFSLYEIYFLLANFHFKFNSTKQEKTFHYKRFSLKVTNKSFTQD